MDLLFARSRVPGWLFIIPALWALVGFTAALTLGILKDTGLLMAGVVGTGLLLNRNRGPAPDAARSTVDAHGA